jgi:hypothetical protein
MTTPPTVLARRIISASSTTPTPQGSDRPRRLTVALPDMALTRDYGPAGGSKYGPMASPDRPIKPFPPEKQQGQSEPQRHPGRPK